MRRLRIALAVLTFVVLSAIFLDVTGFAAAHFGWFAKGQFGPALFAAAHGALWGMGAVLGLLAITFLLGRVYCSVLCPLGIWQDWVSAVVRRLLPKRWRAYAYRPARTKTRAGFLVGTLAAGFLGFHFAFLEPYGIYGRVLATLVAPFARWGNNALVAWCHSRGWYAVKTLEVVWPTAAVAVGVGALLLAVTVCAAAKGRFWCNVVCPVGTLLGCVAHAARVKPTFDTAKCVGCGRCAAVCKAQCLDLANKRVDMSRCVVCFNCTATCAKGALTWK